LSEILTETYSLSTLYIAFILLDTTSGIVDTMPGSPTKKFGMEAVLA
jgi:hypothetical protein